MLAMNMNVFPDLHPAASASLGALDFGRERLLQAIQDLTPEQLAAKPDKFPNSIATLIVHLGASEVAFSHMIMGSKIPDNLVKEYLIDKRSNVLPEPEGETVASLTAKLEKSRALVQQAFASLSDADFDREVPLGQAKATVRWLVGVTPLHQHQHLGHIQMLVNHL